MDRVGTGGRRGREALWDVLLGPQRFPDALVPWLRVQVPCTPEAARSSETSLLLTQLLPRAIRGRGRRQPGSRVLVYSLRLTLGKGKWAHQTQFRFHRWENKGSERQKEGEPGDSFCPSL